MVSLAFVEHKHISGFKHRYIPLGPSVLTFRSDVENSIIKTYTIYNKTPHFQSLHKNNTYKYTRGLIIQYHVHW